MVLDAPTNSSLGGNVGSAGDLDHDGFGDLWVAAPDERIAGLELGQRRRLRHCWARWHLGGSTSAPRPRVVRLAAAPDLGESIGMVAGYGSAAASAGSLTGDGRADIILGERSLRDGLGHVETQAREPGFAGARELALAPANRT